MSDSFNKMGADALAYAVARSIERGCINSRSEIGDALLEYLEIGHIDGPNSVPEWIDQYETKIESRIAKSPEQKNGQNSA
jgi:hypothetical protein